MPTIADFVVVPGAPVTLPKPVAGGEEHEFAPFVPIALDETASRAILFFRINPDGDSRLDILINGSNIFTQSFASGPVQSLHEAFNASVLLSGNNTLIAVNPGPGEIHVSDFVVFFQAIV